MIHSVRGFFRFAHIDGLFPADPAVYARLPKVHQDESRTTEHYDRARGNLDRHGVDFLTTYVAGV